MKELIVIFVVLAGMLIGAGLYVLIVWSQNNAFAICLFSATFQVVGGVLAAKFIVNKIAKDDEDGN